MNHFTLPSFWRRYHQLPKEIRQLADKNYSLLCLGLIHFIPHCTSRKSEKENSFGRSVSGSTIAPWASIKAKASFGFGLARTPNTTNFCHDWQPTMGTKRLPR